MRLRSGPRQPYRRGVLRTDKESSRRAALSALVAVAALASVLTVAVNRDNGGVSELGYAPKPATLDPLPGGHLRLGNGHATIERLSLGKLISDSDLVFIGTAIEKGASEIVSPEEGGVSSELTAHRIRFDVETALRGDVTDPIDVSTLDIAAELDPYVIGQKYLVFVKETLLGTRAIPAVVTNGYYQGAFLASGAESATNDALGTINVPDIAERLKKERKP